MVVDLRQIVSETIELTGAAPPSVFAEDAPVLTDTRASGEGFYLVGLIGGKEVGKSALVNALAGAAITPITSHGPGTETVIAYAHESQKEALRDFLDEEVPGKYRIVTHTVERLRRQVLLDLPDIDSHWAEHVEITRRMLRHMLFPLWIQSIEKYADQQPQQLLAKVAAGNDPANFVFCLNKVDQLTEATAADELRNDFAARLARTLSLPGPPRVWMISAIRPDQFELPQLRATMSEQKSTDSVATSLQLAGRQRERSVARWLDQQNLPARLESLDRVLEEAQETLAARVGVPLLEQAIPNLTDDPANRLALVDSLMTARVRRWPLVNLVHTALAPLMAIVRRNVAPAASGALPSSEGLVDAYLRSDGQQGVSMSLQSAFAHLHQSNPDIATMYAQRKLWDSMSADMAASDLRQRLAGAIDRQREVAQKRFGGGGTSVLLAPFRWLLTIGAVVWFPFAQPVLEVALQQGTAQTLQSLALLIVQVLSVTHMLKSAAFLIIWFTVIWLALRWNTQRRVAAMLGKWATADTDDASVNLSSQAVQWMDELLEPVRGARERMAGLVQRTMVLRRAA